jgi:hypothetical protein
VGRENQGFLAVVGFDFTTHPLPPNIGKASTFHTPREERLREKVTRTTIEALLADGWGRGRG